MKPDEKLVRLEEMKDSMKESIENVKKVIDQQTLLIEIIEASEKSEEFKEFCEQLRQQIEKLSEQKTTLLHRKDLLDALLMECNERETSRLTVRKLLDLFGIFEEN